MTPQKRVRTLIVDDSALVRKLLSESLAKDPEIEVVGTAVDPYVARDKILKLNPDVLTLDIEMPRMDGITFLRRVMKYRPMPVIILSSLTTAGSAKAMEALQAGAVDVLAKPTSWSYEEDHALAEKIKAAARANLRLIQNAVEEDQKPMPVPVKSLGEADHPLSPSAPAAPSPTPPAAPRFITPIKPKILTPIPKSAIPRQVVLLGASTGGTEAIKAVLTRLPAQIPPICIVQHIPAYFSAAFARRLNDLCPFEVREAKAGDAVRPGLVLIAPGGYHMILKWQATHYIVELTTGPAVHHQRPAVDVMFDSAVKAGAGQNTLVVLLTGMGSDGAAGMLSLKNAGAITIAQSEETCVVFGMPREAIRMGAAQHVLGLEKIAPCIQRFAAQPAAKSV